MTTNIPKADMHVHLEGTIAPETVVKLAEKNKVEVPDGLIVDGSFHWPEDGTAASALVGFINAYDLATSVMKSAEDYTTVTYDYLKRTAEEGSIYAEIGISADHGKMVGLTYVEMLDAITKGYEQAKDETGIEMRMISTGVRHYPIESVMEVAKLTRDNPHPLVTGFGLAGDENSNTFEDYKEAFDISGLAYRTAHAGEAAGPESVRQAKEVLGIRRFGHMVRAVEDDALMEELKAINAVPEVCPSSNIVLKVYKDYSEHPLRKMFDYGLKVVLGSDDPPFFFTTIGREYQVAKDHFGFSDEELKQITRNAVEEAFVDTATREALMAKVG